MIRRPTRRWWGSARPSPTRRHRSSMAYRRSAARHCSTSCSARSGIGLSFTRLTIGASDFSPRHYAFDDMPPGARDPTFARFSIEPDRANRLPVVQRALAINPALKIMASPWSAPAWMKSSDRLIKGTLRPDAYEAFAEYLARYVDAYAAEGVPIFALTVQNEPHFEPGDYPGMRLEPPTRARFIGGFLGPRLERAGAGPSFSIGTTTGMSRSHRWPSSATARRGATWLASPGTATVATSRHKRRCTTPFRRLTPISRNAPEGSGRRISPTISCGTCGR